MDETKYDGMSSEVECLTQMAKGVEHIHSKNLVHGNIKPSNVLIYENNRQVILKIADFGLCNQAQGGREYFSPERLASADSIPHSPKEDIFALGCVFNFYLIREHPFGSIETVIIQNILNSAANLTGKWRPLLAK